MQFIAPKLGYIDAPNSHLKKHKNVTPYLGGAGVVGTVIAGLFLYQVEIPSIKVFVLLACMLALFVTGLLDDKYMLSIKTRIFVHIFVAATAVAFGHLIRPTGITFVDYFVSFVGIIAMINAFNILDIMDGLAAGIAVIVLSTLGILIYFNGGNIFYLYLIGTTVIGLLSFLVFNFNPASIFMGDAGSTALGFLIAVVFIHVFRNSPSLSGEIASVAAISLPLFELTFVSIVRVLKGLNPMMGSKDHFPIRIKMMGCSVRRTVLIVYLICCFVGLISVLSLVVNSSFSLFSALFLLLFYFLFGFQLSKVNVD